ncbi:MAG: AMP-binding protein [Bacilli bacterium]|nr:AMP-binding protein [Bacilli bacterium]
MIKEEKISHRIAKNRVKENLNKLQNSTPTIESIFQIVFSHPNYTFLQVVNNAGVEDISYHDAFCQIEKFGSYFQSIIASNSRYVGILLDNKPEWIYSFYGLLMYGYIPVLLSTRNDNDENQEILKKVNSTYVITDIECNLGVNQINPCQEIQIEINHKHEWADEIVFISSGTSGPNKIVAFTGKELCAQVLNCEDIFKKNPILARDYKGYLKHLVVLPFYHIFGFVAVFLWFSFFNVTFVLPMNLSSERIRQACVVCRPTHIFAVPLFFETIVSMIKFNVKSNHLEQKFNKGIKLSLGLQKVFPKFGNTIVRKMLFGKYLEDILGVSIQFCIVGGSQITEETLKIINGIGYPLVNGYGSTEIGIASFANPKKITERVTPNIGLPFKIFDYSLESASDGSSNELYIKSESMFNKALIDNQWITRDKSKKIRTFDVADLINNHYVLKGRVDEIFIGANGENKSISLIEANLNLRYALDSVLIKNQNNDLCLLLSYSANVNDYQIARDLSILTSNIEYRSGSIKKVFATSLVFPKANGIKIKRKKIEELFQSNPNDFRLLNPNDFSDFLNNEEFDKFIVDKIIEIFKQKFPNHPIDAHTDYFADLHGNSLDYFYLVEAIENAFNLHAKNNLTLCRTPGDFSIKIKELLSL